MIQLPVVIHEVDIVARHSDLNAIVEMKNRPFDPPNKNDVIVFFAKLLDYLATNPDLLLKDFCPVFMSNTPLDQSGLAASLGLGIHPVAPDVRPLPLLIHNASVMRNEVQKGLTINVAVRDRYEDFFLTG